MLHKGLAARMYKGLSSSSGKNDQTPEDAVWWWNVLAMYKALGISNPQAEKTKQPMHSPRDTHTSMLVNKHTENTSENHVASPAAQAVIPAAERWRGRGFRVQGLTAEWLQGQCRKLRPCFKKLTWGPAWKGTSCQGWPPGVWSWDPQDGKKELTLPADLHRHTL